MSDAIDELQLSPAVTDCLRAIRSEIEGAYVKAIAQRDERIAALEAVIRRDLHEPQRIAVPFMDGPHLTEREIDEWVCVHCGSHGDAINAIEHDKDCMYIAFLAALGPDVACGMIEPSGDRDIVCGKPARRRIAGMDDGCCDACFDLMLKSFSREELERQYPLVSAA